MRTIILTALLIGYTITVCAQSPETIHANAGTLKIGKPTDISFLRDTLNMGKLEVPFNAKNLYFQDSKDKEVKIGKLAEEYYMAQTGMPILIPKGSFSMPVVKPDSSIHFFMQIKEINRHPFNDFR